MGGPWPSATVLVSVGMGCKISVEKMGNIWGAMGGREPFPVTGPPHTAMDPSGVG